MTCIVGLVHKGRMYMGGDSAAVSGDEVEPVACPKVYKIKQKNGPDAILGYSGPFRAGQVMMSFELPEDSSPDEDKDAHFEFLRKKVVPAVKAFLKANFDDKMPDTTDIGHQLLAYRGRLYEIRDDFAIFPYRFPFYAIGAAGTLAIGALDYAYNNGDIHKVDPAKIVKRVLESATRHSGAVCGPMIVITT